MTVTIAIKSLAAFAHFVIFVVVITKSNIVTSIINHPMFAMVVNIELNVLSKSISMTHLKLNVNMNM